MRPIVYTHAGDFHVDELVAISLLSTFAFNGKSLEIHRTREKDTLIQAMESLDTFVIDVGRVHDPARLNFDHHQNDLAASWEDGLPMSSCGLVWSWLKEEGYLASLQEDEIKRMERDLIKPIDAHDNGVEKWIPAALFKMYNRSGSSPSIINAQFDRAIELAKDLVVNQCNQAKMDCKAERILIEALEQSRERGDGIVIVHGHLQNRSAHSLLAELSGYETNFMIYPQHTGNKNNKWYVHALISEKGASSLKMPIPGEWRGLEDNAVIEIDEGAPIKVGFTHKAGFLAQVHGKLEDAYRFAQAISRHPDNAPSDPVLPSRPRVSI